MRSAHHGRRTANEAIPADTNLRIPKLCHESSSGDSAAVAAAAKMLVRRKIR